MKKIGILTYHRHENYGAVLQAYALQKKIKSLGYDAEIIDYCSTADLKPFSLRAIVRRGLVPAMKSMVGFVLRTPRRSAFRMFCNNNLVMSKNIKEKDLSSLEAQYDVFLVGSDNVWNLEITGFDTAYFLNFVRNSSKKKSYAASFGSDVFPKEHKNAVGLMLKEFSSILVRENSGKNIVKALSGKESTVVLDPTLLLPSDEWEKMADDFYAPNEKYIFAYALVPSKKFMNSLHELSERTHCKVVACAYCTFGDNKIKNLKNLSPEQWIGLIQKSEYVFTDSYHGCIFSIIFKKEFYVFVSQLGTRIENLLNMCSLENRIIDGSHSLPYEKIDYESVNALLNEHALNSERALKSELEI